ncbi:hypothetical protein ACU686_27210 [Yinghuangia aomiensis]
MVWLIVALALFAGAALYTRGVMRAGKSPRARLARTGLAGLVPARVPGRRLGAHRRRGPAGRVGAAVR